MAGRNERVRSKISKTANRISKAAKRGGETVVDAAKDAVDAAKDAARTIRERIEKLGLDTGESGSPLTSRTKQQLYNRARELDIPGRSSMTKDQLIQAIRRAQ